jgi:hypothetical protein
MAIQSINAGAWASVITTTEDTAFQNRGGSVMYLTTESTAGKPLSDGIAVPVGFVAVISSGKSVSVAFPQGSGSVFYVGV